LNKPKGKKDKKQETAEEILKPIIQNSTNTTPHD